MRFNKNAIYRATGLICIALTFVGCGPSARERAAEQKAKIDLERNSQAEAEKGNKAITEMNKKLGRKPPVLDLGLGSKQNPAPAEKSAANP